MNGSLYSSTSIRGIGGVIMGSRRWSGPRRTNILSSLVWLSRGPWIFRSCLPRTTISKVFFPADRRNSTLYYGCKKTQRILNGLPIELFSLINVFSTKLHRIKESQTHLMMPNDSELNWHNRSQQHLRQICVHYRQCWEPSLQRRQQLCCTQPPQCSVGLFCVAAAGVVPKIKGQRDTSPVKLQVSHRPNKVLLMQFFQQMWTGIDVSYMVNRINLKVC